jgi:hypothetical protein
LQAHGSMESAFNAVVLSTDDRTFRVVPFKWTGASYKAQDGPFTAWTKLATPQTKTVGFAVRAETLAWISNPEAELSHPTRGVLKLDDIYVYPDLREIDARPVSNRNSRIVRGEQLLELSAARQRVLITGSREAGKTSLAKRLFRDAVQAGLVPVFLDGRTSRLRGDQRDERELARRFEDQYEASADAYAAIGRELRLVIVDDFHSVPIAQARNAMKSLTHAASRVILLASDVAQVQDLLGLTTHQSGSMECAHFHIMSCGHVRREQLIDKYVRLADRPDDRAETLRAEMRVMLNTAFGTYYAPPIPITIIALLQARAFNDQVNLSQSTYGYYYELLIKRALAQAGSLNEYDISLGYLTALATRLYLDRSKTWDENVFLDVHKAYVETKGLNLKFSDVEGTLLDRGIIVKTGNRFQFNHQHYYYYFVARGLNDGLREPEGREEVRILTERLTDEDSANILLYLTHFSKDPAIIDPMIAQAEKLFLDGDATDLTLAETEVPSLEAALRHATYEERSIDESREHYLAVLDGQQAAAVDAQARTERSTEVRELSLLMDRVYEGFRTMQILGQLLKNFPGTLDASQKHRITLAVYGVALRMLGFIHKFFREHSEETVRSVIDAIRFQHPDMGHEDVAERARDVVYWYIYASAFGMVQRVAQNVGSPLLEPIFDAIEEAHHTPAIRLISAAIKLDRAAGFPQDYVEELSSDLHRNPLALRVLRGLVVTHFHLFDVKPSIKQSVCELLKITYRPALFETQSRMRLLPPPKKSKRKKR